MIASPGTGTRLSSLLLLLLLCMDIEVAFIFKRNDEGVKTFSVGVSSSLSRCMLVRRNELHRNYNHDCMRDASRCQLYVSKTRRCGLCVSFAV